MNKVAEYFGLDMVNYFTVHGQFNIHTLYIKR